MLLSKNAQGSLRALFHGKGRPPVGNTSRRNLSSRVTSNHPLDRRNGLFSPRALLRAPSQASQPQRTLRFASTTITAPLAALPTAPAPVIPETTDASWAAAFNAGISGEPLLKDHHIGYLKELGLDYGWGPTAIMEWLLEHVHVYSGLPWFGTIIASAVLIRLLVLKFFVDAADMSGRVAVLNPHLAPIQARIRTAQQAQDQPAMLEATRELRAMYKAGNVKMSVMFRPMLLQLPLGYGSFRLLRGMATLPVPGLEEGGALWFSNLTIADPLYLLPAAISGLMWYTFQRGSEMGTTGAAANPRMMQFMKYGLPGISFIFIMPQPAAVQVAFATTAALGLGQGALFRNHTFRHIMGMQPLPSNRGAAKASETEKQQAYKGTITMYEPPASSLPPPPPAPKQGIVDRLTKMVGSGNKEEPYRRRRPGPPR